MAPSAAPLDRAPGNTVGRSLQRSARCTYSGYSTRLISAQGSRYSDRRAVPIAVIALDQSDRRAVLIAVIAPDLDGRTKPGFSHLIRDTNKLSTNFLPPSSSSTAPQNTLFDSTFPTLGLEQT
ncbi:hypothetical protein L249_5964 [Ophiocordyceps polyrhachis-furcata BCC 54312]|uniref:Uncharacterized protein n=1 Tax=Ophiocordyceps polyrhachis-furcata BCC 54312 TaxID=1330021 RepID=A0A367LID0_9HYPO|nr:hypothetical protein L249_5964 [Ophiocordyceps polyrhachis-furcata BCC 54312]